MAIKLRKLLCIFAALILGTSAMSAQEADTEQTSRYTGNVEMSFLIPGVAVTTTHGARVGKNWVFGGGTGVGLSWCGIYMPFYGQMRFEAPTSSKTTLFGVANVGLAHNFDDYEDTGFYGLIGFGVRYRRMSYTLGMEFINLKYESHDSGPNGREVFDWCGGPTLRIAYNFGSR